MHVKSNTRQPEAPGRKLHFVWAVTFTLCAVGLWLYLNRSNIQEYRETQRKREAARENISSIKNRINLLKRQQQSLTFNGMEGEKQIRERLQMHKQGEQVMFFVEEGDGVTTTISAISDPTTGTKKTTK